MDNRLIINPLNQTFFLLLALMALLTVVFCLVLKGKPAKTKRITIAGLYLFDIVLFFVYKYYMSLDPQHYLDAGLGTFSWWNELPLHLCNICMMLLPAAILLDNKRLLTFCSFISFPGPIVSMLVPSFGFSGVSILIPRVAGYWITHALILTAGPLLAVNGMYVPRFKDVPRTVLTLICAVMVVYCINLFFRASGLNPVSNYFFLMGPEKNALLERLYAVMPMPLLYIMPIGVLGCFLLFFVHAAAYTLASEVCRRLKKAE